MTPEEFQNNLDNAIEKTVVGLFPAMQEAALTGKALVARRVQNIGFGRQYKTGRYKELRRKKGYEIRFVNLTFTGKMFQGWTVPSSERNGLVVRGLVGGINKEVQNKLKWNSSRFPNFDKPTEEEKGIIIDNLIKPRLKELLQQNLFNR